MKTPKTLRYLYYRCVRIHGRPKEVALGMAIGLAVGLTPTLGVQMLIGIALAAVLGQSKIAAGVGVWISNPVTALPLYLTTYRVGEWTLLALGHPVNDLGGSQEFQHFVEQLSSSGAALSAIQLYGWDAFWHESRTFFALATLGGAILAIPLATAGYWVTYQGVIAYRLKVRHRRANRMHKWKWNRHDGWYRVSRSKPRRERA